MARFQRRVLLRGPHRTQTKRRLSACVPLIAYALGLTAAVALGSVAFLASARVANADAPVAHDNFADAQVMTLGHSVLGSTAGAGVEPGEPACGTGGSIWYRATFTGNGTVRADTVGSDYDTELGVYTGSAVGGLTQVACNDDVAAIRQSDVSFAAVAGTTYYFRVSGFQGATGAVQFTLDLGADLPSNVPPVTTTANVSILASPCFPNSSSSQGPWYRLITPSPTGGVVTISTATSTFDTVLTVLRLEASGFVTEACNDDITGGTTSQVSFTALPGVRYYIAGGGFSGATGTLRLAVTNPAGSGGTAPGPLPVAPIVVPDAPTAPSAIAIEEGATVSWTAPAPGDSPITGYRLTPVAAGTDATPIVFNSTATTQTLHGLSAGTSYTFRVGAFSAAGFGPDSPESNAVVILAGTLGAPTGVIVTGGGANATLNWQAPVVTGGSPVTGYLLTPVVGGLAQATVEVAASPTTYTFGGLTVGDTYTFEVAAENANGPGPIATSSPFTATAPVAHDNFADAQVMTLGHSVLGSTAGAGVEPGEPACGTGGSIWYRATFTGNGTVRADTVGSDYDTELGVYTGSAVGGLTQVACNDDVAAIRQSDVSFAAVAGTTYYFRVSGFQGATGAVQFTLDLGADLPSNVPPVTTTANVSILASPCFPNSSSSQGPWYRLITPSPTGGVVTISTATSTFDTVLTVLRLEASGFVTEACNDDIAGGTTSQVSFTALPGVRYYIAGGGFNGATGTLRLAVTNPAGSGGTAPGPLPVAPPPVNHPPTVASPIVDQTATTGTLFSSTVPAGTFTDPDGDALSYTATLSDDTPLPAWLGFDGPTRAFTGSPAAGDVGTVSVKVTATDPGALSATDTFDIVVAAAPSGTIEVVKHLVPSTDSGTFDLSVDGTTVPDLGDGGTTGQITVGVGSHNVHENEHTSGSLADYVTSVTCVEDPADGTNPASPLTGNGGFEIITVPVAAGDQWVCTETNTHKGTITVVKHLVPSTDPGLFDLYVDAQRTPMGGVGDGGTLGPITLEAGFHNVVEQESLSASLGNYVTSVTCVEDNADGHVNAASPLTGPGGFTIITRPRGGRRPVGVHRDQHAQGHDRGGQAPRAEQRPGAVRPVGRRHDRAEPRRRGHHRSDHRRGWQPQRARERARNRIPRELLDLGHVRRGQRRWPCQRGQPAHRPRRLHDHHGPRGGRRPVGVHRDQHSGHGDPDRGQACRQ